MLVVVPLQWITYVITFDTKFIWTSLACFVSGGYLYALSESLFSKDKEKI